MGANEGSSAKLVMPASHNIPSRFIYALQFSSQAAIAHNNRLDHRVCFGTNLTPVKLTVSQPHSC